MPQGVHERLGLVAIEKVDFFEGRLQLLKHLFLRFNRCEIRVSPRRQRRTAWQQFVACASG
jgi:hypothetical protein